MVTHLTVHAAVSRRRGASLRYCVPGFTSSARSRRTKEFFNEYRARATARQRPRPRWLATLGTLFERAPVGNGARGLQPRRHGLGVLSPRSRAQPRLSMG